MLTGASLWMNEWLNSMRSSWLEWWWCHITAPYNKRQTSTTRTGCTKMNELAMPWLWVRTERANHAIHWSQAQMLSRSAALNQLFYSRGRCLMLKCEKIARWNLFYYGLFSAFFSVRSTWYNLEILVNYLPINWNRNHHQIWFDQLLWKNRKTTFSSPVCYKTSRYLVIRSRASPSHILWW